MYPIIALLHGNVGFYFMAGIGGRTSTTWAAGGSWNSGKTKTVRIPEALENQIMAYARAIDSDNGLLHGNEAEVILNAIAKYIEYKRQNYHPNQNSKQLDPTTRSWDELRKFADMVKTRPEKLGLKPVSNNAHFEG